MANAIHPDYFHDFSKVSKEVKELPIQEREEVALAEMSELAGWKVLEEFIDALQGRLDAILSTALESGASYEEIGQKTIVTQLAKSYLRLVVEKVADAREALQPK